MIQIEELFVKSQAGKPLIEVKSLQLPSHQLSMIIGPNGAGKTLLLRCLAGLQKINRGLILLQGKNASQLSVTKRSRLLSWVPANYEVSFDFKVIDIVLMGRFPIHQGLASENDYQYCQNILDELEIRHLESRKLISLSQGERIKVQLARALVAETPILLLDEVCANLDIKAKIDTLLYLKALCLQKRTIILSHHDLYNIAGYADHLVVMKEGHMTHVGPCSEIFTAPLIQQTFELSPQFFEKTCDQKVKLLF